LNSKKRPLILITNDDGVHSPGLLAAARSVIDLGETWVVAPRTQQSGSGRSFPPRKFEIQETMLDVDGVFLRALAMDTSPAQAVRNGLLRFLPRLPDLAIAGINYGENIGGTVTISGTIGAAIEAASFGIPTLAAALETEKKYHMSISPEVDFRTASGFVRRISRWILEHGMPPAVDILKLDVPWGAGPDTPLRVTRVSRQPYWVSPVITDSEGQRHLEGYMRHVERETLEPDSDVHAIAVDHVVSLSPLTIDLTAPVSLSDLVNLLNL